MPVPPVLGLMRLRYESLADFAEQVVADLQWQALPRRTVGLGAERGDRGALPAASQVTNFAARNIAVQDLLREQSHRRCRVQLAFTPTVIMLAANSLDRATIQNRGEIALDVLKRVGDTCHPWPPVGG